MNLINSLKWFVYIMVCYPFQQHSVINCLVRMEDYVETKRMDIVVRVSMVTMETNVCVCYFYLISLFQCFLPTFRCKTSNKKSLNIAKAVLEAVSWRRTDNTKAKIERTNGQTMIYKTLHRKHEPTKTGGEFKCSGRVYSFCSSHES